MEVEQSLSERLCRGTDIVREPQTDDFPLLQQLKGIAMSMVAFV